MNFTNYNDYLTNDKLFLFQSNTIRDMAEKDSCVIIGRCADYILRGRKDMLSVFIHAPMELRIQRISRVRNVRKTPRGPSSKDGPSACQLLQLLRGQRLGAADSWLTWPSTPASWAWKNPLRFSAGICEHL